MALKLLTSSMTAVPSQCLGCRFRREQLELLAQRPLSYCTLRSFRPCSDVNRGGDCQRFRAPTAVLATPRPHRPLLAWSLALVVAVWIAAALLHALG